MNKIMVIQLIKNLSAKPRGLGSSEDKLLEIETIIKNYLEEHPKDTDMWLRLAMLEHNPPWEDPYRIQQYLNTILLYDAYNIQAVLSLAYFEDYFFGKMKETTFTALCNLKTVDREVLSMIEYAKAMYYYEVDKAQYVHHLFQSINVYDRNVNNLKALGKYFLKHGEIKKGKELLLRALNNIQIIYNDNYVNNDVTDINEFFAYYYKGTHTTEFVKEDLLQLLHDS